MALHSNRLPALDMRIGHALAQLLAGTSNGTQYHEFREPWKDILIGLSELPVQERLTFMETEVGKLPGITWDSLGKWILGFDPLATILENADRTPFPFPHIYSRETETESEVPPFRLTPAKDFLDQACQEIKWAIESILPEAGIGILAGPPAYGKSWMLLDLAIESARGGNWLGHFTTLPGPVIYIDEESAPALTKFRFKKLLAGKGLLNCNLNLHFGIGEGLRFDDDRSVRALRQSLASIRPQLVIVDALIRVHHCEENSASEMSRVFGVIKNLVRDFECAFLFADHQRKPGNVITSSDLLVRGSSDKVAAVDTLLSMKRMDDEIIIEHAKSRYGHPVSSFAIQITDPGPGITVVSYVGEAEVRHWSATIGAVKPILEQTIPHNGDWVARKTIVEACKNAKIGPKVLDQILKELVTKNDLEREDRKPEAGRGGKAAYYRWHPEATPFPVSPSI